MLLLIVRWVAVTALLLVLVACGRGNGAGRYAEDYDSDYEPEIESVDYDPADIDAGDVEQPDFDGCTDDCSGHEAGFQWAQDNDVADESDCSGNSHSFSEGCEAFAQARAEVAEEEAIEQARMDQEAAEEYEAEQDEDRF